jgi:hypothetical protein
MVMRNLSGWAGEIGCARSGMGISSTKGTRVKALSIGTVGGAGGAIDMPD